MIIAAVSAKAAPLPRARALRSFARWLLLACLGAASYASDARATPDYPLVLDAFFMTSCPNPNSRCVICHTSSRGGQATAVRPFATTLRPLGLNRGRDVGALQGALTRLPDTTDSDEDGVPDTEELMLCGNPSGADLGAGPEYGCDGAHLAAPPARDDAPLALISLLAASVIVRRRRGPVCAAPRRRFADRG